MIKTKIIYRLPIILFIMLLFLAIGQHNMIENSGQNWLESDFEKDDAFRKLSVSKEMSEYMKFQSKNASRDVCLYFFETKFGKSEFRKNYQKEVFDECEKKWKNNKCYQKLMNACIQIFGEVKYFPVPVALDDKRATVSYCDSWMATRSYREHNSHEGTDIMAHINKRGYYPVISMTDGTITNLGWLELGGYRVGITTKSNSYFYYAHLASYANIKEGMEIKAGDLLGFMGDSGYGSEEGTVGKFPVHLHLGIYLYPDGEEISVNPYAVLRYSEKRKISCDYR